ncbi:hypothetical protein C8R43DRAFT_1121797 [Mycena crocata]|nr:hypothetical protein C8R43DRAFT_1121797 [Mycena crocata]
MDDFHGLISAPRDLPGGTPFLRPIQMGPPDYRGSIPPGWENFPPLSPRPYEFATLEDTDRLPRPSDYMSPWGLQSPWGPSWASNPPPLMDPGFGIPPPSTPFNGMIYNNGNPIVPVPMDYPPAIDPQSPFGMNSRPIPFAALPQTPLPQSWPQMPMPMTPGTPGMDLQPILFTKKYVYDYEYENQAPRPSDWRRDYAPPRRFRIVPRLKREKIKINLEHCHLSPYLLMPNSKVPVLSFDLRSDHPFDPANLELLTTSGRPFNPTDLSQFATTRPVYRLRFYHPRLPWYIDVRASQPNGVLVGDVLHQIHEKLQRPIRPQDFSNKILDATDRELITEAYRARCDDRVDIMRGGVLRVDFMGSDVILRGFVEGRNGMWLMKTSPYHRNTDG